jgi:CheY-like chemotaxis protein
VLVVEPNSTNRRYIAGLLKTWGCKCDQTQDGISALTLLQAAAEGSDPFDTVIISRRLPEMDGKRLGATIKTNPLFSRIRLLLMAWWGERLDGADLLAVGFSGMLTKPIKHRALYDSLGIGEQRARDNKTRETVLRPIDATREHLVTVLVVEDNLIGQKILSKMLEKLGCHCEFALNGREALERLSATDYDLVLMDCHMPVMDGYETARRIRSPNGTVRNARIPIIAVTANAMEGDREKCLSAGMDDYLPKPLAPRALARAIEQWLAHSRKIPAGRRHSAE